MLLAAYCKSRGVTTQAAGRAIRAGKLGDAAWKNSSGDYVVLPRAADLAWGKRAQTGAQLPASKPAELDETVRLRREREAIALERDRFELEERRKLFMPITEARARGRRMGAELREALLQLPDRISPKLAAESNVRACHALLTEEVRRVLTDLTESITTI